MKYKVMHSTIDDYQVYRTFHYTPNKLIGVKGFSAIALLSVGLLLALPMPDDVLLYGATGKYFASTFGMTLTKGIMYAALAYEAAGIALIAVACILGGSYIKDKLKTQVRHHMKKINGIRHKIASCF